MLYKYCSIAIALLAGSASANPFAAKTSPDTPKSAYTAKLLRKAIPTKNSQLRKLDGAAEVDLTSYSLKFEKCQFVKSYSQDLAEEGADSILATDRFVVFRLCPGSCKSCNSNYGEYVVDMETYLESTVEYFSTAQEEYCEECQETCNYQGDDNANQNQGDDQQQQQGDDQQDNGDGRKLAYYANSIDCSTCSTECSKIDSMEDNNYLDATNFINCQQIAEEDNYGNSALYAGPMCASSGSKIKIGVFSDEDCFFLDTSKDVDSYLTNENGQGVKLSHQLLKKVYDSSTDCISCAGDAADDNGNAENLDVCEELYEGAGKCESEHGFAAMQSNKYYAYNANNQVESEDLVCSYIDSLQRGTYSQDGEIVIGGSKIYTKGGTSTTGGQKFALTFFIIGTVGLAVYAAMLHSQLTKGSGKADLSSQGGAMA